MARKSKLTEAQWAEIEEKLLAGANQRDVAAEYGMSQRAIGKKLGIRILEIKTVANQMVEAKTAFDNLPIAAKINAQILADRLMNISNHLTSAAELSSMNAHKFSRLSNNFLETLDEKNLMDNPDTLRLISGLTTLANESSKIPLGLIQANKEQMQRLHEPEAEQVKTLNDFYARNSDA